MPPDPPSPLLDAPAQAERTALAWQRTGLGVLGIGAALIHVDDGPAHPWRLAPGVVVLAAGVVTFSVGTRWRYRRITTRLARGASPAAPRSLLALAIVVSATPPAAAILLMT